MGAATASRLLRVGGGKGDAADHQVVLISLFACVLGDEGGVSAVDAGGAGAGDRLGGGRGGDGGEEQREKDCDFHRSDDIRCFGWMVEGCAKKERIPL